MEGKFELQFEDNEYYLVDGNTNDTVATTDKVLLKEYDGYMKKLSLKNCQAIENGYDLIKLIEENSKYSEEDWGDGFLFAMNLMSDKKFDEFLDREKELGISDIKTIERIQWYYKTYFDKSQQTEWDVEIETIEYGLGNDENGRPVFETRNLLDADGCLILKRK